MAAVGASMRPDFFVWDRPALVHGEFWRLWTGHLVHFGPSHLVADLIVFLIAGVWLERISPPKLRWLLLVLPPVLGVVLFRGEPGMTRYGGLSGVTAGVITVLGLELVGERGWRGIGTVLLLVLGLKIGFELIRGAPLVADFAADGVRSVPLAHVAGGLLGAIGWGAVEGWRRWRRNP